jgi:hypothetical protein
MIFDLTLPQGSQWQFLSFRPRVLDFERVYGVNWYAAKKKKPWLYSCTVIQRTTVKAQGKELKRVKRDKKYLAQIVLRSLESERVPVMLTVRLYIRPRD